MPDAFSIALLEQLVRSGLFNADDIGDMADRLDAEGETDAARIARATLLQAVAPSQSEWEAEQRRARFAVVPDGGNATP